MWSNIPKPTASNYTNVNPQGKTQYDQVDITYDDPNMFYDGLDVNMWTDIGKPSTGLTWNDLVIAWQNYNSPWGSPEWTNINKPNV